jgi:hypothetical protein
LLDLTGDGAEHIISPLPGWVQFAPVAAFDFWEGTMKPCIPAIGFSAPWLIGCATTGSASGPGAASTANGAALHFVREDGHVLGARCAAARNDVIIELAVGSPRSVELVEVMVRGTQIVLKILGLEGDPEVSPENFAGALQRAIAMARKEIESPKKS